LRAGSGQLNQYVHAERLWAMGAALASPMVGFTHAYWGMQLSDHMPLNGARYRRIRPPRLISPHGPRTGQVRRHRVPFRQKDLQRVLKAFQDAGVGVQQVEIDPTTGKITVTPGDPKKAGDENGIVANWRASRARSA
jgi:hypothetical protein